MHRKWCISCCGECAPTQEPEMDVRGNAVSGSWSMSLMLTSESSTVYTAGNCSVLRLWQIGEVGLKEWNNQNADHKKRGQNGHLILPLIKTNRERAEWLQEAVRIILDIDPALKLNSSGPTRPLWCVCGSVSGMDEVLPSLLLAFHSRERRERGTVTLKQGLQTGTWVGAAMWWRLKMWQT